jgi:hypothetical protein
MPTKKVPIAKRAHKKSRNGCQQCKVRKVKVSLELGKIVTRADSYGKCDERKPLCGNCEKHFDGLDECDFPTTARALSKSWDFYPTPPATRTQDQCKEKDARHALLSRLSSISPLGSGIDPFMVHPNSNVPEAQFLMHHCTSCFRQQCP